MGCAVHCNANALFYQLWLLVILQHFWYHIKLIVISLALPHKNFGDFSLIEARKKVKTMKSHQSEKVEWLCVLLFSIR